MKCKYNEDELVLYYYDELEDVVKGKLKKHLEGCSECRSSLEKIKNAFDRIELQEPELSQAQWDNYRVRVHEKIEGRAPRGKSVLFKPAIIRAAVAAMFIIVVTFGGMKYYEVKESDKFIMENYELMLDLEFIEDLEILEYLDEIEEA